MFSYKITLVQLASENPTARLEYGHWFLNNLNNDNVLDKTFNSFYIDVTEYSTLNSKVRENTISFVIK